MKSLPLFFALLALVLAVGCGDENGTATTPETDGPPATTPEAGGPPAAGPATGPATALEGPVASPPLAKDVSALEVADSKKLADVAPQDFPDLHNVFRLSDNIISGSEPHGEEALKRLAEMGVKTILSVDGKAPDAETAAKLGMRYVHVPIQYNGITPTERLRIAKVFLELEGPFFVHCFHGQHRGPAAAAWGRVVLDGAPREEALAEMKQWCGTSKKYEGLFEVIGKAAAPTGYEVKSLDWDFPAKHEFEGFRGAMVVISRAYDHLKALKKKNWKTDPEHPDLSALNEARKLAEAFAGAAKLEEVASRPEDFRKWNDKSLEQAEKLAKKLEKVAEGDKDARDAADRAFQAISERCDACHKAYRNR